MIETLSLDLMMVIYVITHVTSERRYVGQTTKKAKHRWREHCNAGRGSSDQTYNHSMYITNAICKYGVEAFTFEVIEQCSSKQELDKRENFWIKKLGTLKPNGFNLRDGPLGMVGVKVAASVGRKISKANKGRVKGPEWCAALSRSSLGKKMSVEACLKISKAVLGRKDSPETRLKKSLALKDRELGPYSEERCVAVRAGMARMTPDAKAEMIRKGSETRTGRKQGPHSEIHRLKLAISHLKRSVKCSKSEDRRNKAAARLMIMERYLSNIDG